MALNLALILEQESLRMAFRFLRHVTLTIVNSLLILFSRPMIFNFHLDILEILLSQSVLNDSKYKINSVVHIDSQLEL